MLLTPAHSARLHERSAIADALIQQRGYQSLPHPEDLIDRGFSKAQAKTAPALGIPLWDVHGERHGWQIRPDAPRQFKDGTVAKYETAAGDRNILDIHPSMQPLIGDPAVTLWITEGVIKGDALTSRGQCTIALVGGVWGFRGSNAHHGKVVLEDWNYVALNGRLVNVVFDSDIYLKRGVQEALDALYRLLRDKHARPCLVRWPEEYRQRKVGVDDFFAQGHTLAELQAFLPAAGPLPEKPPAAVPPTLQTDDPAATLGTVSPCTHVANARRLTREYHATLRYVLGEGWIMWTGKFWRPDPTKEDALALGHVSSVAHHIAREAAVLYALASRATNSEDRKTLYALAAARGQWAAQTEQAGTIAASLKLAKHALMLTHDEINQDPWLLNVQNGTIDLRTGTLRAHASTDFITHLAPVTYDPAATCSRWLRFLLEVFARDKAMVRFMQRALGWSLTGVVQDRALFFLYGAQGHNGKTTLVETFRDLLGTSGEESFGYARKVDVTTFLHSKNHDENQRKASQLTGARFIYSSEVGEDQRLNEQLVKDMTGGDTLEARKLYREAFNFKPQFKPWMYGNHKPEVRGTDDALWSRVKLVEFPVSFAGRANTKLAAELRAELPGILNWAIQGCLDWQNNGLNPPEKVAIATEAYRKEQDVIGQFVQECCQTGKDYLQCKASLLYRAYATWAEENGHFALSQKRFGSYLTAHGYPSDNNENGHGALRLRIGLTVPPEDWDTQHDATLRDQNATLRNKRVANNNANNINGKQGDIPPNATLATLKTRKSRIEQNFERFSENTGSKGSKSGVESSEQQQKQSVNDATLSHAKGSIAACPHTSTTEDRQMDGSVLVRCATCHKILSVR
jgi:putative DNA primase/helicase